MLVFEVQGSAKAPYTVKAFGSGPELELRCSCPAGARGGLFCKHVAALLAGDVTNVVSGADSADELLRRAEGSPLLARSMAATAEPDVAGIEGIEDFERRFRGALEASGWAVVKLEEHEPWRSDTLALHGFFKNGRMKKGPTHQLSFEAEIADPIWHDDGSITYENQRPSARPWRLRSKAISRAKSFTRADAACAEFLRLALPD
mgnify:CR=1 FL=1